MVKLLEHLARRRRKTRAGDASSVGSSSFVLSKVEEQQQQQANSSDDDDDERSLLDGGESVVSQQSVESSGSCVRKQQQRKKRFLGRSNSNRSNRWRRGCSKSNENDKDKLNYEAHQNSSDDDCSCATLPLTPETAPAAVDPPEPQAGGRRGGKIKSHSKRRGSRNSRELLGMAVEAAPDSPQAKKTTDENREVNRRNGIAREAAALDRSGNELFEKGKYDEAFIRYERALTLKRSLQSTLPEGASSVEGDGDVQSSCGNQEPLGDGSQKSTLLASVATSINNMTYLKQRSGKASADETMAAYIKALQIKRDILGPDHLSVGKTLNNIGSVFYLKKEYEAALAAYKEAHRIMEARLGDSHLDVGTVISNIGDVHYAAGRKGEARGRYRQALSIRWEELGPSDPKVVRLMENIASLETGMQPSKSEEELSDSEASEYEEEDRRRHEAFQDDLRVLNEELQEDIKFFDLLEREAAINLVKDKTKILKEMYNIAGGEEKSEEGATQDSEHADEDKIDSAQSNVPRDAQAAAAAVVPPTVSPVANNPLVVKSRKGSILTPEERQTALSSVKDRLANIKAMRVARSTKPTTQPVKHRSYMEPTQSSSAKVVSPRKPSSTIQLIDNTNKSQHSSSTEEKAASYFV